jgi:ribose-phosphate pyrophosphokinase
MTVQLVIDNITIPIKHIPFSDGSSTIKLEIPENFKPSAYYAISVDQTTKADDYLWEIAIVNDAVDRTWGWDTFKRSILMLPYLPHARADRVFEQGNPLPLDIFFHAISNMFDDVHLVDPHSDFYKTYEDSFDFSVKYQHQCFIDVVGNKIKSGDIPISPDKAALNKIYKLQQALDMRIIATRVLEAGKKRDTETGRVIETTLPEGVDLTDQVCWIVDDIADGGGTFLPLAAKLKEVGAKQVNLYVTHGIFAKGLSSFQGLVDNIYTYQTIGTHINQIHIDNFNKGII